MKLTLIVLLAFCAIGVQSDNTKVIINAKAVILKANAFINTIAVKVSKDVGANRQKAQIQWDKFNKQITKFNLGSHSECDTKYTPLLKNYRSNLDLGIMNCTDQISKLMTGVGSIGPELQSAIDKNCVGTNDCTTIINALLTTDARILRTIGDSFRQIDVCYSDLLSKADIFYNQQIKEIAVCVSK